MIGFRELKYTPAIKRPIYTAWHEPAFLAICAIILAAQVLIPPFIGIADNGDFPKIAGPLSLGPKSGNENFIFFVADYVRAPQHHWESQTRSTELPLAWIASRLARATKDGDEFDIRWLGAIHGAILLCALYALLRGLRTLAPWQRMLLAATVIIVFTDVQYVAYFNSFYTDAAALLGLLLAVAFAVQIAVKGFSAGNAILFCLAALLFIGSKPQHAIWGFLFAAFLILVGRKRSSASRVLRDGQATSLPHKSTSLASCVGRADSLPVPEAGVSPPTPTNKYREVADSFSTVSTSMPHALAVLLIGASVLTIRLAPPDYAAPPLFTLIFSKLVQSGPKPQEVLAELGLPAEDIAFVGMHAFRPEAPISDPEWVRDFTIRVNHGVILKLYLRHPLRALALLDETLKLEAYRLRPPNLSNFRREDDHPPGALTNRFAFWSDCRRALYQAWPYHVVVWFLLVIAGSIRCIFMRQGPVRVLLGWITLGIVALAAGEFSVSALADAAETYRHLFIFHACTDFTVCFAIAAVLSWKLDPT